MANNVGKLLILLLLSGFAATACKPKKSESKHYLEPSSAGEKAKLEKGLAYRAKDGKLYSPIKSLKSAPKAAPGFKSQRAKLLPFQSLKGKYYYFPAKALAELGIKRPSSKIKKPVAAVAAKLTVKERGEILAVVNGKNITVGELFDKINSRPPAWRRIFAKKEKKLEFLNNNIIVEMLLYDAAVNSNMKNDPVVQEAAKKRMSDLLRREQITKIRAKVKVTDAQMKKYYDANKPQFVQPEGIIAAHILVTTKGEADKIVTELSGKDSKKRGRKWRNLVTKFSIDSKTKAKGGLLGDASHRVISQNDKNYDKVLVDAIWNLKKNGDTGGPVKSATGWHVIKRYNKRKALNITFAQAKRRLKRLVERQEINKAYKAWVESLKIKYKVKTFEDNVKFIKVTAEKAVDKKKLAKKAAEHAKKHAGKH
jgi:parvulin-like peptidyl-prolyl isomerase